MHKTSLTMHKNKNEIQERRAKVSSLLAQSMTEMEIASQLSVDQSTVSRDIKALKEQSQQFVYDLAKSDLAFYYKQCIEGVEAVLKEAWKMFHNNNDTIKSKDKLLKVALEAYDTKFSFYERGPNIMNIKSLEERLNKIETRQVH